MGDMSGRLARLKASAESRGPIEPREVDDNEFVSARVVVIPLPPLDPSIGEVLFPEGPADLARIANYNNGLDCETFLIQPGRSVPRLVVTGYQSADGTQKIVTGDANDPSVHAREFLTFTERIVRKFVERMPAMDTIAGAEGPDLNRGLLTNQNISFDFLTVAEDAHQCDVVQGKVGYADSWFEAVMYRIFEMLDLGVVEDTQLRERLIDLSEGSLGMDFSSVTKEGRPRRKSYALKWLAGHYLNTQLDKTTWRTGYSKYLNVPLEEYPDGARDYVTHDVVAALHVATRQQQRAVLHGLPAGARLPNSSEQSKASFALNLISSYGLRTDLSKVQQLDADLDQQSRKMLYVLKDSGLIRPDGTKNLKLTKEWVSRYYAEAGLVVPLTKSGKNISTAGSVLEDIALIRLRGSSVDVLDENGQLDETELFGEPLYALSQHVSIEKLQSTYLPVLYAGTQYPINPRYETLVATGRTSSFSPNIQNLPRGGAKTLLARLQSKVRECFVPRPGFVFNSVDFSFLELCTFAQVCVWMNVSTKMADTINAGIDPHLLMAAEQFLGVSYEQALATKKEKHVADMRQLVKAANFGYIGGLSHNTFIAYCKSSYGVYITEGEAKATKEKWLAQWQVKGYFNIIKNLMRGFNDKGEPVGDIEQFVSGRVRGKAKYCAVANGFVQSLAADGAKSATYEVAKACYLRNGAMYGARSVAFIHDEIITEIPEGRAHEYAHAQVEIMVKAMQTVCPDVKISAAPALMRSWYKGAEAVYDKADKLIPWEPHA